MKQKLLLILLIISVSFSYSQIKKEEANQRITSSTYLENLIKSRATNNYVVTSEYTDTKSGIKHTYVRQAINGIEVYGTESSIHTDASGKTIVAHVNFVDAIDSSVKNSSASLSAEAAIARVAQQMGYNVSNLQRLENASGANQKGVFNKGGISKRNIPVKLMYHYQDGIGTSMVWELSVVELEGPDWWNFYVDASSGVIIHKENWTVSCNIRGDHSDHGHEEMAKMKKKTMNQVKAAKQGQATSKEITGIGSLYTVFALPLESPYSGPRSTVFSPDNFLASPLGWHDDGTAFYAYTKGNNVSAYDDGSDDDTGLISDHAPESAAGSEYDYAFDLVDGGSGDPKYTSALQSENAAITNLFYWNNIIHDITYQYGFDEASGNFQEANVVTGSGLGSDSVNAEAQDSADLSPTAFNRCNANFGTPPDGSNPRMQMYICDNVSDGLFNDGDYDSNVIIHEYAHGISNRLTGGPSVSGGLNNAEQMGEGWSDFYGYMLTMDASNATADRAIGNFLFELGPGGGGIRNAPYSTSMATNPFTYADVAASGTVSSPHGIGFIWATMLYEMTQNLITVHGFDPDLYTGTGGNNIALELVTLGLKLQPTSPGFVDGRDAILLADTMLYGSANHCSIWEAFAKRGLGISADQGSSGSRFDGIEAFDLVSFVPSRTSICMTEGVVSGIGGGIVIGGTYSDTSGLIVSDGGDGLTFSFDPVAAGVGDHVVTYTEPCTGTTAMATITVTDGIPELVCQDATLTLDASGAATLVEADVVVITASDGSSGYTVDTSGTFAPVDMTSGTTALTLSDDSGVGVALPFTFSFYGIAYTTVYVTSNGYLTFSADDLTDFSSDPIPTVALPNNIIAVAWDDLNPALGGTIHYKVIGTAPARTLVVEYDNVPHFGSAGLTMDTQVMLYETSNRVEIHSTSIASDGGTRTQGIENADGSAGEPVTGRNNVDWTATSDYVAFVPIGGGLPDNCGNPVTVSLSQSAFTCADVGTVTVTVTADDGFGGIATCDATITVIDNILPTISCPLDITVGSVGPYTLPDYYGDGDVTTTDNCPVVVTQTPVPGTVLPDGDYTIDFVVTDPAGATSTCSFFLKVEDSTLGLDEFEILQETIALFPNPTTGDLTIRNNGNLELLNLKVYNVLGSVIQQTDLKGMGLDKKISMQDYANGVYFIQINTGTSSITKRVVKQ